MAVELRFPVPLMTEAAFRSQAGERIMFEPGISLAYNLRRRR